MIIYIFFNLDVPGATHDYDESNETIHIKIR